MQTLMNAPAAILAMTLACGTPCIAEGQKRPLAASDIAEIVVLERIEDRRDFDAAALERIATAKHPELRRRAALTIARLYEWRGRELLRKMRNDADTVVLATVAWATGQLVDTSAVPWLDSLLQNPRSPIGVATEAAGAFGKIRTSDTRSRLANYLGTAAQTARTAPVVGEALLSIGRAQRGEAKSLARWVKSPNSEVRWRTAWALRSSRDTFSTRAALVLSKDALPEARFWAVAQLSRARMDSFPDGAAQARAVLQAAIRDADRRVQVSAIRAMGSYTDSTSFNLIVPFIDSNDPWLATVAAEAVARRGAEGRRAITPLSNVVRLSRSAWTRATALTALATISLPDARALVLAAATDTSLAVRSAAVDLLPRLGAEGRAALETMRAERDRSLRTSVFAAFLSASDSLFSTPASRRTAYSAALASPDVAVRTGALLSMMKWADSTDIPAVVDAFALALSDSAVSAQAMAIEVLAEIDSKANGKALAALFARIPAAPSEIAWGFAGRAFGAKILPVWGNGRPIRTTRTDADYDRIVRTLIVPAYNGAANPRLRWETTRGPVETELNPLDTPLATDYLLQLVQQGAMRNIRFDRVIPNFVAQQREVLIDEPLQRDEISRGRLVRGNLSWGSNIGNSQRFPGRGPGAAYDTGPAVYVFAHTPQPHNEGDFAALGRIVRGMNAVDRMELGDYVVSVSVVRPGRD